MRLELKFGNKSMNVWKNLELTKSIQGAINEHKRTRKWNSKYKKTLFRLEMSDYEFDKFIDEIVIPEFKTDKKVERK